MLLSLNWLREFVPYEGTAQELGDRLTMLGLELEDIRRPYDDIRHMTVGHVLTCAPHPESDHLSVCMVDVGSGEPLPIVCGAPNVAAGQKVPVALVGTVMPGGMEIKKAKLRGQLSCGMICSERELGLTEDHSGIMVLPESTPVGARLVDALALDMEVLDISITPNRADALSVLGLARETAMAFRLPLHLPKVHLVEAGADWTAQCDIHIADSALCPLYQLRLVENVTVAPSPSCIRYRLHAMGVRSISNVVDVTNYILMELGQPLHAFDLERLEGGRIEISPARDGEELITLDGQLRQLKAGDLLIRDGVKPVGLAGVMGGANSEMTASSHHVLIEAAVFHPGTIRKTARRLGLSSEASYRFERGVDQVSNTYAMNRAAAMIATLSGGVVRTGVARREPRPWEAPHTLFRHKRAVSLLGLDVPVSFCNETLTGLGCTLDTADAASWVVRTPSWRADLSREVDLIEEVARVYGMDRLPETLPTVTRTLDRFGGPESQHAFLARVRRWGSGLGLNEAINYSFVGHKALDQLHLPQEDRITILNPLSEDQNVLRTALAPSLLENVRHNIAHGNAGVRLFEVATVFYADAASPTTAREQTRLGVVMHGARQDTGWPSPEADADYHDLRGVVEHAVAFLHLPAPRFEAWSNGVDGAEHPYLLPCVRVVVDGQEVGVAGRVKPHIADTCHARKDIWLADLNLDELGCMHHSVQPRFVPLPVYPPVRRDITVASPVSLSAQTVMDQVRSMGVETLADITLIDLFEPKDSQERNATYRLTFRHAARTLKDAEVDKERDRIAQSLVSTLDVRI